MHPFLSTITTLALISLCIACQQNKDPQAKQPYVTTSPRVINTITFTLSEAGEPTYEVRHRGKVVIEPSSMGFELKNQKPMQKGFRISETRESQIRESWDMPWGEQQRVTNHGNEQMIALEETADPKRKLNLYFRAYDDGVAFRYEFPPQEGIDSLVILDEHTHFQLTGDHVVWWIPADWDSYEHLYQTTRFTEIDALGQRDKHSLGQVSIKDNAVHTPVTMRTSDGLHLSFHEANLRDYASMTLLVDNSQKSMRSRLVPSDRFGYAVKRALPFKTPWRTIQIAEKATELIDSKLILNLNEPNQLGDVSWFEPQKYMGIWWEMHLNVGTWDYGMTLDEETGEWVDTGQAHGKHSATTENTKRYIDFAAANGIRGLLVEGWNTGWELWTDPEKRAGIFDFITPYPDYDLKEVVQYGREKGVEIIMHHETSAAIPTYEQQMDTAYQLMQDLGIHAVKSGYVGKIIPKGEYHHGQWMVNHYQKALEKAAKYQIAVNAHEPIKATGLRRTFPNAIAREGLRGQEFNAWARDGGNPPEHISIVAFTRMLAGPIDFTPGVFDIELPAKPNNRVQTTLAQQLAQFVVIYSPIQMACDLPQNYENQPAFQFIRDVGVDWKQSLVLNGAVGDFVTIAREEKGTDNWFVGGVTDEQAREVTLDFDFLEREQLYEATVYKDALNAHYQTNPTAIEIEKREVQKGESLMLSLAPGGGFAISLMRKEL